MKMSYQDGEWQTQVVGTIRGVSDLRKYVRVDGIEAEGIAAAEAEFSWRVTPYYAGLMARDDPNCPVRMQAIPREVELHDPVGLMDPLAEEKMRLTTVATASG